MRQHLFLFILLVFIAFDTKANFPYLSLHDSVASLKPVITYREEPALTSEAIDAGVHGFVWLSVILYSNGTIGGIKPLSELPSGLTQKAIDAAYQIRFKPAQKNGTPVSVRMAIEFTFRYDYSDTQHLRAGLSFAFPHLSKNIVEELVKKIDSQRPDSMVADSLVLAYEQQGVQLLSNSEREKYLELKQKAIKALPEAIRNHAEELLGQDRDKKISSDENVALNMLIFQGVSKSSIGNLKHFVTLHNKAVQLGLRQEQTK